MTDEDVRSLERRAREAPADDTTVRTWIRALERGIGRRELLLRVASLAWSGSREARRAIEDFTAWPEPDGLLGGRATNRAPLAAVAAVKAVAFPPQQGILRLVGARDDAVVFAGTGRSVILGADTLETRNELEGRAVALVGDDLLLARGDSLELHDPAGALVASAPLGRDLDRVQVLGDRLVVSRTTEFLAVSAGADFGRTLWKRSRTLASRALVGWDDNFIVHGTGHIERLDWAGQTLSEKQSADAQHPEFLLRHGKALVVGRARVAGQGEGAHDLAFHHAQGLNWRVTLPSVHATRPVLSEGLLVHVESRRFAEWGSFVTVSRVSRSRPDAWRSFDMGTWRPPRVLARAGALLFAVRVSLADDRAFVEAFDLERKGSRIFSRELDLGGLQSHTHVDLALIPRGVIVMVSAVQGCRVYRLG